MQNFEIAYFNDVSVWLSVWASRRDEVALILIEHVQYFFRPLAPHSTLGLALGFCDENFSANLWEGGGVYCRHTQYNKKSSIFFILNRARPGPAQGPDPINTIWQHFWDPLSSGRARGPPVGSLTKKTFLCTWLNNYSFTNETFFKRSHPPPTFEKFFVKNSKL